MWLWVRGTVQIMEVHPPWFRRPFSQTAITDTDTHPFNGPLSGTTQVSRYQKGKTNLDFTEATDSEWQWHQLCQMQVWTSLLTDNHASTPPLSFFTGRMPFLLPNQQRQCTEGISEQWTNKIPAASGLPGLEFETSVFVAFVALLADHPDQVAKSENHQKQTTINLLSN